MRNCFVPFCDGKNKKNAKRMMFQAPKDEDLFEKWKSVLPKKREFRKRDKVCEQHFHESDIEVSWDHTINGVVVKMPRDKPRLRKSAVPILNIPSDATMKTLNQGTRSYNKKNPRCKSPVKQDKPENPPLAPPTPNTTPCEVLQSSDALLVEMIDEADLAEKVKGAKAEAISAEFDALFDDIFEVVLPTTLWGFHRDPNRQFIAFSEFSPSCMGVLKTVMLNASLQYQFSLRSKGVRRGSLKSGDPEEISRLLAELDEYNENTKGENAAKHF